MTHETQRSCMDRFAADRAAVSHRLFRNEFLGSLQPGLDERLSGRDVVLRTCQDDAAARQSVLDSLEVWCRQVEPPLLDLLDNVESHYGLVPTPRWNEETIRVREAMRLISTFLDFIDEGTVSDPEERATSFWDACDSIKRFLESLYRSLHEYFSRWDGSLIKPGKDR